MPAGRSEKTPSEVIGILPEEERGIAKRFVELGAALHCKSKVRFAPAHKTWKCVFERTRPSRVLFTLECTPERWRIKACLWNIDAYRDALGACGDAVKDAIRGAYDCRICNDRCKGGARFTFEGVEYAKCVGCCFYFADLREEDWNGLLALIGREHEASGQS